MELTVLAPAKVNLWLRIGRRGSDGYHPLDTLFCALELADAVTVRPRPGLERPVLETTFAAPLSALPEMGRDDDNLAVRAAHAFAGVAGFPAAFEIGLIKRIPAGGGLGGGSSDAAAVLRALARLHPGAVPRAGLEEIAAGLGSDVPFFLSGLPLALGTGRGERLRPLPALPSRPVVLALPPFRMGTAGAYAAVDAGRRVGGAEGVEGAEDSAGKALDWDALERRAVNDFEPALFPRYPLLRELRDVLRDEGAALALLAGSGSSVFGVFATEAAAAGAADRLKAAFSDVAVVITRTVKPPRD